MAKKREEKIDNKEFVDLMLKKASQKDVPKPDSLILDRKRDPESKANILYVDQEEIEKIAKKIKEKIK